MRLKHGTMGLAVGHAFPVVQVEHRDPAAPNDNGITLYFHDAPGPDVEPTIDDCRPICVHCILKSHPTIGKGLRAAEETGCAVFVGGTWWPAKRSPP